MGATGTYKNDTVVLSIVNAFLFLGIKLIQNVKIIIPKNFYIYIIFLVSLLIHSYMFDGRFDYFFIFLSGGLYWFHFHNMKVIASKYFPNFLIFLGISMSLYFVYSYLNHTYYLSEANLFLPASKLINHNHIGDLWAIVLIPIAYQFINRKHNRHYIVIFIGLIMIALSNSRSAIVALAVGITKINKKYSFAIFAICIILFIYFGIGKTTLFARPYFLEALYGLIKYPNGLGIGNFGKIASDSTLTHNIILEIISGMGVYSVIFIFWLFKVFQSVIKSDNTLYIAIFLAIFTNFMFDTTYVIPTMVWLWFAGLALI